MGILRINWTSKRQLLHHWDRLDNLDASKTISTCICVLPPPALTLQVVCRKTLCSGAPHACMYLLEENTGVLVEAGGAASADLSQTKRANEQINMEHELKQHLLPCISLQYIIKLLFHFFLPDLLKNSLLTWMQNHPGKGILSSMVPV